MPAARFVLAAVAVAAVAPPLSAGVIVVGNFTPSAVTLTVADGPKATRAVPLASLQVSPVVVAGPVDVSFPVRGGTRTLRVEPTNAYVLMVDDKDGRRLEGIRLPGDPLPEDEKATDDPPPKAGPLRVPVTLLVDDLDPRTDRVWQAAVRKRFDAAAASIEEASGVRFEVDAFATWTQDPTTFDLLGALEHFEKTVPAKVGRVYVGFTSRRYDDKKADIPFGLCRGALGTHVLMREWRPTAEPLKVEALTKVLAQIVGAVPSPDPGSVMRPNPDDLALRADHRTHFDPLNALAMSLWADELRKGGRATLADVTPANKARLGRVYRALGEAMPDDRRAVGYFNDLQNPAVARRPDDRGPAGKGPDVDPGRPAPPPAANRDDGRGAVRAVVKAVAARARLNAGLPEKADDGGLARLVGDPLTAAYVQAAADAAMEADTNHRATAFVVGLGVALDDGGVLRDDPLTGPFVKAVESDADRAERLAVLGLPTARGRRDVLQRFAVAAATADLMGPSAAFEGGISRSLFDLHKPVGFGFAAVAADLAGAEFAERVKADLELVGRYRKRFRPADVVPPLDGLRDGLSAERFEQDYGAADDPRFKAVVDDIRKRIDGLAAGGKRP